VAYTQLPDGGDQFEDWLDIAKGSLTDGKGEGADPWGNIRDTDKAALDRYRDAIKAADDAVKQNRDTFRGFLGDLKEGIMAGEKLGEVLKNAFGNLLNTFADRALDNLADMIFPTSKSAGGNAGPLGILGALFGGGKSVAANDNWGGLRSANDNFSAPVGAVTRAPLADISAFRSAIKSIESAGSGGYSALGPLTKGDRAYGAYQVMGNNVGPWSEAALGRRLTPSQFLSDPSAQDAVFDHRFGGYVDKYGASGAAQAWFGGPGSVGKGGAGTDILGTSGNAYVNKFNASLNGATKNVDQFGKGLGQIGSALSQFPAAPTGGAGGGAGGILGSLFGGLSSAFSGTKAFSFLSANPGKFINFYADGADSAEPGVAMVGERGPEMVRFRGGERVIPNHKLGGANSNSPQKMEFNINITGANGDAHVVALARQATSAALAQYDEAQRRGGQAAASKRYGALRA